MAVLVAVAMTAFFRHERPPAKAPRPAAAVPVTVATAAQENVPIYLSALGTVQAWNTISVHTQVDGTLDAVNFTQGQEVHKGDVLARIDPRALQATLDQAIAKKGEDQAQLVDYQKDLARFKNLASKSFETQQNVDAQQAKVDAEQATIQADQAAIESAQTQLSYATITSPIDGVTGFRQVDAGNIVHTTDPNPLTVITQIKPVQVTFTLPQANLAEVREAMLRGKVTVLAYDQDDKTELAQGQLMLINNQIDQTTSTISLKASFPNQDERLWPGEFLRVRVEVAVRNDAITIPSVAVQRGPEGPYTWVIKPDNTADQRSIETTPVNADTALVDKGVSAGEKVVVDGQYRLEAGAHVQAKPAAPTRSASAEP
ncbi:MAG TPA: efflux RND transporter periplasmic adaptor subunit [Xanthobacteraceae bacterium]|nr:efflux RND transporter periplasmic adaptor subunit [Xanthobacteraceae bacterium]